LGGGFINIVLKRARRQERKEQAKVQRLRASGCSKEKPEREMLVRARRMRFETFFGVRSASP
jgi:hypothetical protein